MMTSSHAIAAVTKAVLSRGRHGFSINYRADNYREYGQDYWLCRRVFIKEGKARVSSNGYFRSDEVLASRERLAPIPGEEREWSVALSVVANWNAHLADLAADAAR